ncbi:citrate/2-methylcitrate synthase [Spirochaeta africana]|uniref:Citrate synthase n=1 Tax=Spirochaeta africana (strain ATCC 700263 / DSM 8902 / Z-7692) TaxID=889378 RepID=H9UMI5_SPIAZ|nr:citrate/2-methylcitrate synthase [Spirochaeta africana]AFG38728.1 citrate synthase [Spirochaeta africana DSM 8902]
MANELDRIEEERLARVTELILEAKERAMAEIGGDLERDLTDNVDWPVQCTVGPGLEGAIACETKIGYVNGAQGMLYYRGYNIFDLCAYSSFEETTYLLLHGRLPSQKELDSFKDVLRKNMFIPKTQRLLMTFPIEDMGPMASLRLGTNLMRQKQTYRDSDEQYYSTDSIASDEDSIAMETKPRGSEESRFEFMKRVMKRPASAAKNLVSAEEIESCYKLIAGVPSIAATIGRVREGHIPLEPLPDLSLAGNYLYMLTGRKPTRLEERVMDINLILHADHGMNASTFASLVVASTLSDIYFAIGSGIAALSGPLHGGANVEVVKMLETIGGPKKVASWYKKARGEGKKITGFGHRVYKSYDPRARILGPMAGLLAEENEQLRGLFDTATELEKQVIASLGSEKGIYPNVDFYSGIVYRSMGIPTDLYTTIFAVSRVAGWTSRVLEYLAHNRIFRPRAFYTGTLEEPYIPIDQR